PLSKSFARKNPVVSRTLRVRGDQTLEDLHRAIFEAFGRTEEQMYEFHLGKGLLDPGGRRYVLPGAAGMVPDGGNPPAGRVHDTSRDGLGLAAGQSFAYWFDFAADWWHQVTVRAVDDTVPRGKFPKVTKRVGEDPPQQVEEGRAEDEGPQAITGDAA